MGLIILATFISIYVYQFNYYKKKGLSYTCLIISLIFLIIQSVLIIDEAEFITDELLKRANEDFVTFIGYYIIYYCFLGFVSIFVGYIPIYKYKQGITKTSLVNYYINILTTKNSCCSRSDYWFFYAICIITAGLSGGIFGMLHIDENSSIRILVNLIIPVLNIIFQAKRLNDIAISKCFLFIYLVAFLGSSFGFVADLVMLAIMCLPSQQIPTTDIKKTIYTKEN